MTVEVGQRRKWNNEPDLPTFTVVRISGDDCDIRYGGVAAPILVRDTVWIVDGRSTAVEADHAE